MAGLSEVFNLDFKFGGNSEFLARLESLMERVDARFDSVSDGIEDAADATKEMADKVDDLDGSLKKGLKSLGEFGEKLKDVAGYYLTFTMAKEGAERVWSFGMESMEAYSTQERAENQLKGVMKNRGSLGQFDTIKSYAADIQGRSIYGDEAMIKGAGELATYVKGTDSLKAMMDLLTDYAAGMTGGGEVSPEQMESLATGLGMAYDGNYMAMRRKGFDTSKLEALDAIAENNGKWGAAEKKKYGDVLDADTIKKIREYKGVTEQMRVDALKESLEDWKGLSNAVNGLDSSALIRFNNKIGDLRENIGKKLYPTFNALVNAVDAHMPDIEDAFNTIGDMFKTIAESIERNMNVIKGLVKVVSTLIEIVAEFPQATIAAAVSLKMLASGSFTAAGAMGKLAMNAGLAGGKLKALGLAAGLLAGGAIAGVEGAGAESLEGGVTNGVGGVLGTVATAALAGASAFGVMGAAAAAAAASVVAAYQSISGEIEAYLEIKEKEETWNDKSKGYDKMLNTQKMVKAAEKNGDTVKASQLRTKLQHQIIDFEDRWGEGSAGTGLHGTAMGGIANYQAMKQRNEAAKAALQTGAKVDMSTTFNTTNIEQNVSLAADISKVGILLNQNIRALMETQLRQNREVSLVNGI